MSGAENARVDPDALARAGELCSPIGAAPGAAGRVGAPTPTYSVEGLCGDAINQHPSMIIRATQKNRMSKPVINSDVG